MRWLVLFTEVSAVALLQAHSQPYSLRWFMPYVKITQAVLGESWRVLARRLRSFFLVMRLGTSQLSEFFVVSLETRF